MYRLKPLIGPNIDIPAPDVGTDGTIMGAAAPPVHRRRARAAQAARRGHRQGHAHRRLRGPREGHRPGPRVLHPGVVRRPRRHARGQHLHRCRASATWAQRGRDPLRPGRAAAGGQRRGRHHLQSQRPRRERARSPTCTTIRRTSAAPWRGSRRRSRSPRATSWTSRPTSASPRRWAARSPGPWPSASSASSSRKARTARPRRKATACWPSAASS